LKGLIGPLYLEKMDNLSATLSSIMIFTLYGQVNDFGGYRHTIDCAKGIILLMSYLLACLEILKALIASLKIPELSI